MDSGTSKSYKTLHGVPERDFELLIKNISDSLNFKRENNLDVVIGTQYLMLPQNINEEDINGIINRFKNINPAYISFKPYSDHPRSRKNLIVEPQKYIYIENLLNNLKPEVNFEIEFRKSTISRIEKLTYDECYGLSFFALIDAGGNILPCNLFYGIEEFTYGNLYNNSFSEIWKGDKRKEVLSKLKDRGVENCRKGCRCDAGNSYLERLKKPQFHDNFT